jgi:hypothetical protein
MHKYRLRIITTEKFYSTLLFNNLIKKVIIMQKVEIYDESAFDSIMKLANDNTSSHISLLFI